MIRQKITDLITKGFDALELKQSDFIIEHPKELQNGDYSTNVALIAAKSLGKNPQEFAEEFVKIIDQYKPEEIEKIEIAGPGFINFHLSTQFFEDSIKEIINQEEGFGFNNNLEGQKTIIEFTDPNPFKEFHIGHLMSNTIGEAISRLAEANGAEVKRANYQGDTGIHVAKAIWGMIENRSAFPEDADSLEDKINFLSNSYAFGSKQFEVDPQVAEEIKNINKKIYEKSDKEIEIYYDKGRAWSLEAFEKMYELLGTKFDYYFYESEVGPFGAQVVLDGLEKHVFEKSDGAVVYKGEKEGLHTRVFINSQGLPTYEAKELGLSKKKSEIYDYDKSIVVTGNEIDGYFKVILSAMEKIFPDLREKTKHISHGMLRLPTGKMSSRTGDVITARGIISDINERLSKKMADRNFEEDELKEISNILAISSLKYSILKQSPGKDIVFDFDKSLSFEGDSGPYLEYTATRAKSLLHKALGESVHNFNVKQPESWKVNNLEKLLYRFPEIIEKSYMELAPQQVVGYLTEVASAFNSFYGSEQIIDNSNPEENYKLALSEATRVVLVNGLKVLGMRVPEKM